MSNEEKARELDAKFKNFMYSPKQGPSFQQCLTEMAEWKEQETLKKVKNWLKEHVADYIEVDDWDSVTYYVNDMLEDFEKDFDKGL